NKVEQVLSEVVVEVDDVALRVSLLSGLRSRLGLLLRTNLVSAVLCLRTLCHLPAQRLTSGWGQAVFSNCRLPRLRVFKTLCDFVVSVKTFMEVHASHIQAVNI